MTTRSQLIYNMILCIADFFRYMSDNADHLLYYTIPIQQGSPYAYQNSTIRDVATICDILDLIQFFKLHEMTLPPNSLVLFEKATKNTMQTYYNSYQKDTLPEFPDGNIGDIGFFLLFLKKCESVFPSLLPNHWKETQAQLIKRLLEWQNPDGSFRLFFNDRLEKYEKSSEAFYLPEALIGLIASLDNNPKDLAQIQKGINYCCQNETRKQNLATDNATFYANWQFKLLFHWVLGNHHSATAEANHLEKLTDSLMNSRIAKETFGNHVATVEVACYLEGIVHALHTFKMLNISTQKYDEWFEKESDRCLQFLYEIQSVNLPAFKGGFVHSRHSHEARIDVAGHVFSGLSLLL